MVSSFRPGSLLTKLLGGRTRKKTPCRKARYVALGLETLESREVPATFNWITTAAGTYNWSSPSNWQGGLAPVAANLTGDDIVNFTAALAGHVTVVVDGDYAIAQLNIGDPSGTQTYTLSAGGTGTGLNFAVDTLSASITKTNAGGGTDSILAPINLTAGLTIADSTANALNVAGNIAMNGETLSVGGSGNITIGGVISGTSTAGITKTGTGDLTLSNGNTYTGATTIQQGILIAAANSALGSAASGTTVDPGAALGFSSNVNYTTPEAVNVSGSGIANDAYVGFTGATGGAESIQKILNWTYSSGSTSLNYSSGFASSTFQLNGGAVLSGTALELTDGNGNEARSAFLPTAVSVAGFTSAFQFTYGANPTADGFTFCVQNTGPTAVGGGGGSLGYAGIGESVAVEFNLYSGVSQLGVDTNGTISHTIDLTASGINFHTNPTDTYQANVTYDGVGVITVTVTDTTIGKTTGALTFNDTIPATIGGSGAIINLSGTNSFAGPIILSANSTIGANSGTLNLSGNASLNSYALTTAGAGNTAISGVISGTGVVGLIKTGSGTLTLSNSNTYAGTTSIQQGVVIAAANSSLGPGASSVTVTSGGDLAFASNVNYTTAQPVMLGSSQSAYVGFTGATGGANSTQDILNWTYSSGATSLNYASGFTNNTFQLNGGATIQGTALQLTDGNDNEARSAFIPVPVYVGAFTSTFEFTYGANPMADGFTFAIQNDGATAVGTAGAGNQLGYGGIPGNSIAVEFNLYNNVSQVGVGTNGAINHTTDLTASNINFHTNPTDIYQATVTYNGSNTITLTVKDTTTGATTSALNFSDTVPVSPGGSGTLENIGGANSFAGPITVGASGTIQSDAGSLTLGGALALNSYALSVTGAGNTIFGGAVSGSGSALTKGGAGTLTLSGANTYTGATAVNGGYLQVNGSLSSSSAVTVASGATLEGDGTIGGTATVNGSLTPGGPVVLTTGALSFGTTGYYDDALYVTSSGTGYGQTVETSASGVNLSNSPDLNLRLGFTPAAGAQFTIIKQTGGGSVTGNFNGLPQGSIITVGSQSFQISYVGGSGHDIVLTAKSSPSVTTTPPGSQSVFAGGTATFTAAISGPTSTVQWLVSTDGGLTFTQIAGATSTTLTVNNVTFAQNGYLYEAVFTNSIGVAITSAALLTVDTAPVVTTQPTNQSVTAGNNATFTAAASGNPAPTVQWQFSSNGGTSYVPISGATSTTLTVPSVSTAQSGYLYEAVFNNGGGSATSNPASLTVNTLPVVTTSPVSQTILAGSSATFTAAGSGSPAPAVQWEVSVNGGVTFSPIGGANSTSLTLTNVPSSSDGTEYEAVFTNAAGSVASTPATLTVQYAPVVTGQPSSQTVTGGSSAVFTAAASGDPTPTVQWQLSTNSGVSFSPISGATSTTLAVTGITSAYNGYEYKAVFANNLGSATSSPAVLSFPTLANIIQYHGNDQSIGVNSSEFTLTPANVTLGSFGKLFSVPLDDQVYAQPLVDNGITINNGVNTQTGAAGVHNVVYVCTESDEIYAVDTGTGAVLWGRTFLNLSTTGDVNNTLGASAIGPQDATDAGSQNIAPNIGITGTPVIDNSTNTMYVVVSTKETINGTSYFVQRLHAINLSDGTDQVSPYLIGTTTNGNTNSTPIYAYGTGDGEVTDPYNGTGKDVVQFNALRENQRAALSLVAGTVFVEWASHGDVGPYHGWVVKWNVSNLMTNGFVLTGVLCTSPNDGLAGIWSGGGQLTFDPDGSGMYFSTGNGSGGAPTINAAGFPSDANYNEAVVKIANDPTTTGGTNMNANGWGFKVVDWFIPYNVVALDDADDDLGSGAILILPSSAGVPGHPNLLIAGGKEGALYVLDRDNLGHYNATSDAALNSVPNGTGDNTPPDDQVSGLLSTPSYFDGNIYAMSGYEGAMYEFALSSTGTLTAVSETADTDFGYNPGSPIISANGTNDGIVWVYDRQANELHAYAATSLGTELWNSNMNTSGADQLGAAQEFAVPVVANGDVFVATSDALAVYGLLSPPTAVPIAPVLSGTANGGLSVNLTWTDPTTIPNTASGYTIEESTDDIHFTPVATAVAGATSVSVGGLQPLTQYYFEITGFNSLGSSSPSNVVSITTSYLTPAVNFSSGFANASTTMALNGSTDINGNRLELTNLASGEASSAFYTTPVDVTGFTNQFTFQLSSGSGTGAGFTFTIQGESPTVVGSNGAGLGYAGITPSVAVKFDLYNDNGEGVDSTGLFSGGAAPTNSGSVDLTSSGVNLHSGDIMSVNMTYNGTTLTVIITDTVTGASATQRYTVNIPSLVNGNVAYVGFTAGTEGVPTVQDVLSWTYSPDASVSPYPPVGLGAIPITATSVKLTWTNPANNNQIGYYLVRATNSSFTNNVVTQSLPATPSSFTDSANGLAPGNTYYYELQAYNSAGSSSFSNVVTVTIPNTPPTPTLQQVTGVTTTEIDLTWQDNAGHAATSYQILEAVNFGTFFTAAVLPPTSRTPPDQYGWDATGLTPGTYYEFHIEALNSSGHEDFAGLNATTLTLPPTGLTATAGDDVINLSWTAPSFANSNGALTYNIYRGTSPGGEGATPIATGVTTTSYADTALSGGTTYYYTVTAVNPNSGYQPPLPAESAASSEASAGPVDVVTTQPANQTVNVGQTAVFTAASANPSGTDTVQWRVNTGSGFVNILDNSVYSGSATTTLTVAGATAAMNGYEYDAVFTNSIGSLTTNAATLYVGPPSLAGLPVVNGSSTAINIVSATGNGTTATITTGGTPNGFWVGELVTLTGVSPGGQGGLAGTVTVTGVPSVTSFQFASTYSGTETLTGATVRAALAGAQRSMVDSIVYSFTQPVTLTAAAFSISVVVDNTSTGNMVGVAPTLNVASVPFTNEWVVTFTDPVNGSVIGNSIANGAYSISINPAMVTAVSGGQNLSAGETDTFYRLYGDVTGVQSVKNVDANAFNRAWGNAYYSANFNAALDYNDDGKFTNIDANAFNRAFNTRYNVVTTI